MAATVQTQVAFLNRAIKGADATAADFATQVAALTANQMSGADAFDIPSLSNADLAHLVLTNMGLLPTTVAGIAALEPALTDYFATAGKGHRGFVVLQLSQILSDLAADTTSANGKIYNAAGTAWNATAAASVAQSAPGTYALTTAVETVKGGLADDIFNAITSALNGTLNATDVIDGGAGNDTLNVTLGADFGGFTVGTGSMANVETVNLTNSGVAARSFAAKAVTGVKTINVSGEVNLANLDSAATTVNLSGPTAPTGTITIGHNPEAISGSADVSTVGLSGVGATATRAKVSDTGIETLNLVATGANVVALVGDAALTTLNISGAGTLNLTNLGATDGGTTTALTTVDGSAATGALTIDLAAATGKNLRTVKTGAGNDTVTANVSDDIAVNASIDAGAGTNKLVVQGAAANVQYTLANVPTVDVGAITGTLNFSAANASTAISTINVTKTAGDGITSNFSNLGSGALTVNVNADLSTDTAKAHTLNADASGAATVNLVVSSAASATAGETATDVVGLSKASSLTLNVPAFGTYSGNVTANLATSATVNIAGVLNDTVAVPAATAVTINQTNASTSTSSTVSLTSATTTSVMKSLNVAAASTLNLTPDANALASLQNVTIANTNVAFGSNALDLSAVNNLTASGTGTSAKTTVGLLGAANLGYGITVAATGDRAGFVVAGDSTGTAEFIKTGSDQAITIDVSGVTGSRAIAYDTTASAANAILVAQVSSNDTGSITINAAGSGTVSTSSPTTLKVGNVQAKTISIDLSSSKGDATVGTVSSNVTGGSATIKAAGLTGNLTLGNVTAKTISVDLNNVTGTSGLGTLTGDAVTVDGTNASGAITTGTITAKNSLTFNGSTVNNNSETVVITSTSTAFSAALKGGFLQDNHSFTSNAAGQTSITLTGDLGTFVSGSADNVTVSSTASTVAAGQTIDLSGLAVASGATTTIRGSFFTGNTIKGTAGNDTIYGGSKADTIYLGTGNDTVILNNPTDTGAAPTTGTGKIVNGTALTAGGSFNVVTQALDVVYNFGASDKLEVGVNTGAVTQYTYGNNFAVGANGAQLVTGNYDSSAGTFTFAAGGKDSLFVFDGDNNAANAYQAVVLVGYVAATGTADGITGIVGAAA